MRPELGGEPVLGTEQQGTQAVRLQWLPTLVVAPHSGAEDLQQRALILCSGAMHIEISLHSQIFLKNCGYM